MHSLDKLLAYLYQKGYLDEAIELRILCSRLTFKMAAIKRS